MGNGPGDAYTSGDPDIPEYGIRLGRGWNGEINLILLVLQFMEFQDSKNRVGEISGGSDRGYFRGFERGLRGEGEVELPLPCGHKGELQEELDDGRQRAIALRPTTVKAEDLLPHRRGRFMENLKIQKGDVVIKKDELGLYVTVSQRVHSLIREQLEDVVVVKILGRCMGYGLLCNRIRALWDLKGEFMVTHLDDRFYLVQFCCGDDADRVLLGESYGIMAGANNKRNGKGKAKENKERMRSNKGIIASLNPTFSGVANIEALKVGNKRVRMGEMPWDKSCHTPSSNQVNTGLSVTLKQDMVGLVDMQVQEAPSAEGCHPRRSDALLVLQ
ncbi:hypothetical protein Sjap_003142 [Stephania japonica]|uniref:DUF4283 domain-containing protein n=1 Tax=Stephania japonica TaxID=461633 RepID=A0AAP0PTA7_9MAGN